MLKLIDKLTEKYPENSKSSLDKWIKHGRILVDGQVAKRKDQEVSINAEVTLSEKKAKKMHPFKIFFEDSDLIVLCKPYNILTVDSLDPKEQSVHAILKRVYKPTRIYPVHRLDREVYGLIIFAKSKRAHEAMKEAFFDRSIKRVYHALVHGSPEREKGDWQSFLQENKNYIVKGNASEGKHAITYYQVLRQGDHGTLLKLTLDTGRKNQLRVHTKEAGCPILGDGKYGIEDGFKNLALFAHKLTFRHPFSDELLSFSVEAPLFFKKYQTKLGL